MTAENAGDLALWREKNGGMSGHTAARLFGLSAAANYFRIERGEYWVGPAAALRIETITKKMGPFCVTVGGVLSNWERAHPELARSEIAAAEAAILAHREHPQAKSREVKQPKRRSRKKHEHDEPKKPKRYR